MNLDVLPWACAGVLAVAAAALLAAWRRAAARARRAEDALRTSDTRFRALLEHGSDVVLLLGPDGTILYDAPQRGRVLGYADENWVGHTVFELIHPEDQADTRAALEAVRRTRESLQVRLRARHKDGSWRWLEGAAVNLLDELTVRAIVVNYRDVTARLEAEQALRESEEQFRAMFEAAAVGMTQVDPVTLRFLRVNAKFCQISGYGAAELLGRPFPEITHPDDREADLTMFRRMVQGMFPATTVEKRYVRRDGPVVWVEVTATLVRDAAGNPARTVGVVHDITERKRAQEMLRRAHDELELTVRERTAALRAANDALQAEAAEHRRTAEALRNSEALYHSLVEHVPMHVYRKDRDGRYVFANRQWCAAHGVTPKELAGKTVFDLFPPPDAEKYTADDRRILETGEAFHDIEEHQTGTGQRLFVEVIKTAVRDHREQIIGTQGAFWDVTERKRTEGALAEERLLLRTLVNHLPDYIYVKDAQSRFLLNNPAHLTLLGAAAQEDAAGKTDFDFFPEGLARRYFADEQDVLRHGRPLREREEATADARGAAQWVLTTKVPLHNAWGQITGLVGISRDITRLKQVEEKLRRAGEELERRVAERTAELAAANAELARSNADLQQFAYVASHDLQEPLRAVAGCVTLLKQRYGDRLDERAAEYMAHAVDGATRMQALIEDLLAYSRVGTRGRPFEPVDCAAIVDQVLADLQVAVRESGACVTRGPLPTLPADAVQLGQLFQNLLANAIKFRGPRPPEVHVGADREDNGWHFTVADNGVGIEPRYAERIFRLFQRLHTRREYPGTGIGLAICKKIVERHGGRIWVESNPGEGATFHWTLPDRR